MTRDRSVLSPNQLILAISQVMQTRKTVKALGNINKLIPAPEDFPQKVQNAMTLAGWAPFHYPAHSTHLDRMMSSPVPWRFYSLNQKNCLRLARSIMSSPELETDESSKIIRLLATCGALVMVTWLPEPDESTRASDPARRVHIDEEHLAAAGAATQNLLLAAKAQGVDSYWSSGGVLKDWECFDMCGIPVKEKLLGAIFMFPEQLKDKGIDIRKGGLRDRRGSPNEWMNWITV